MYDASNLVLHVPWEEVGASIIGDSTSLPDGTHFTPPMVPVCFPPPPEFLRVVLHLVTLSDVLLHNTRRHLWLNAKHALHQDLGNAVVIWYGIVGSSGLGVYLFQQPVQKGVGNVVQGVTIDMVLQAQRERGSKLGPRVSVIFAAG